MNDEKQLSLTPEGFEWLYCLDCKCSWQSCQDADQCQECGSNNFIPLEDTKETDEQEDH